MKQMTLKTTSGLSLPAVKDRSSRGALWRFPARVPLLLLVTGLCLQMPAVWAQQQETPGKAAIPQESPFGTYGSFEKLLQAAQGGDADAQVKVGLCYGKGIGVTQDYEKAFTWVMKSAEQGNALGAYLVADCYMQGKGVEQNIPQAMEWFTKAANQGIAIAQYNLGAIYLKGLFDIPKDEKKAFFWTEKAANQGDKEAQYNLGISYCNGLGVPKNLEKAFYWFEKAAEQGEPNAQASLGLLYINDDKDVSSVFTQASKYYWAQQEAGKEELDALSSPFPDKETQRKFEKMMHWMGKAAEQGNSFSQRELGFIYAYGIGGIKKDLKRGIEFLKKSAEGGDAEAQYIIGIHYAGMTSYLGTVSQNIPKAREWLQKSAEQGHERAREALKQLTEAKASS